MARNAHPEVTRNRILDAAQQLFITKGYEHTSIQNIVDELGDLSKGAIYHHFKSKEDILEELINRDNDVQDDFNESVMDRSDLTALEKFRILWRYSITTQDHVQIMRAAMPMLSDPVSFAANMRIWSKHLPERFLPLIEEGVKDGSIPTAYPREAAELLSLLPNYWLMPYFYPASLSEMEHRVRCLAAMLSAIGVPIFDDELIEITARGMMIFDRLPSERGAKERLTMNTAIKRKNDNSTQRPLRSRDFVLLVAGQGISLFGNMMLQFAMSMWVLDETGSATIFASVLAISIVPTILLSPFGGVLADRVNRRTIMVALDAISAVLVLASAIVFASTGFHIASIATMQVLLAVLGAFETPTVQAALPQMFRQHGPATMRQGMAVINQVQQLSSLLPSFLGGVLYAMFGIRLMMIITIVSFAGAAALECFIRLGAPDRGDEELPTPLEDLKAGVRFLIRDRPNVFKLLLFAAALNFVLIGYSGVGFPYTIRTVLGFDATIYGIADGLIGVSGVAGAFTTALFAALTVLMVPLAEQFED